MESIQRIQALLEAFNLVRLTHHGAEQSAHEVDHPLLQFPAALAWA